MAVRVTIEIPQSLHIRLRQRTKSSGTSIRALIVRAIEETSTEPKKGELVNGFLIRTKGKLGSRFPVDENPYDLIFP
jgi:hypothetical protein